MKKSWFALLVLAVLTAMTLPATAGVMILPANEIIYNPPIDTIHPDRSGHWWNPENVMVNDSLFAIDTVIQFHYDTLGVGFANPGAHPTWVITNVSLSARHRGHYWNTRARYIPYVDGHPLINEADTALIWPPVRFGVTEMTNTTQITQLDTALTDSTWDWADIAGLSMKYEPRAHGVVYYLDFLYATVTYVDTASPDTGHYFEFEYIPEPQLVGHAFPVVIYAKDHLGTVIPDFNDSTSLTDSTGTINPTFGWFHSGICSLMVTISELSTATAITVNDGDTNAVSNGFSVVNPGLHHFEFLDITSPETLGAAFPVTIVASDFYGDTIASFSQQTNLSDLTGTMAPTQTDAFTDGIWSDSVTVNSATTWDVLTCEYTSFDTLFAGSSNGFEVVDPNILHHFEIAPIGTPQTKNVPFSVTMTACGIFGNTLATFVGKIDLWDGTGTLNLDSTGSFVDGVWSGPVTVTATSPCDTLFYSYSDAKGLYTGFSNGFEVQEQMGTSGKPTQPQALAKAFDVRISPNPARTRASIELAIPNPGRVTATLYNILGQSVTSRDFGTMAVGRRTVEWSFENRPRPGVYFLAFDLGNTSRIVKKLTVVQ